MKCDYHVHSYYSEDSNTAMERQIKRACRFTQYRNINRENSGLVQRLSVS